MLLVVVVVAVVSVIVVIVIVTVIILFSGVMFLFVTRTKTRHDKQQHTGRQTQANIQTMVDVIVGFAVNVDVCVLNVDGFC